MFRDSNADMVSYVVYSLLVSIDWSIIQIESLTFCLFSSNFLECVLELFLPLPLSMPDLDMVITIRTQVTIIVTKGMTYTVQNRNVKNPLRKLPKLFVPTPYRFWSISSNLSVQVWRDTWPRWLSILKW